MQDFEAWDHPADGETDHERWQKEKETEGEGRREWPLTDEEVPLDVQVGLVGQAAPHHVAAVVLAGFQSGQSAAVGTVHHPGQGHAAAWEYVHLRQRTVPPLTFHLLFRDIRH